MPSILTYPANDPTRAPSIHNIKFLVVHRHGQTGDHGDPGLQKIGQIVEDFYENIEHFYKKVFKQAKSMS